MKKDAIANQLEEIKSLIKKGDDKPLNFKEACAYLGFAPSYLYKLTYRKIIPHYKPSGKMLFFSKAELDEWIFSQRDGKPKNRDQKSEDRNQNEDEEDEEDPASPNGYAVTSAADHSKWDYE